MPRPAQDDAPRSRVPVSAAVRSHYTTVIGVALFALLVALIAGLVRSPTYTARTELNVGKVDVQTAAVPGLVAAIQSLAAAYSRTIDAQGVVTPVARRLKLAPGDVAARVSASPVPESPLIRVTAQADDPGTAVSLANVTSQSLIDYTTQVNSTNPDSARLLAQFRKATVRLSAARQNRDRVRLRYERAPTTENQAALNEAGAEVDAVRLEVTSLGDQYRASVQGLARGQIIQILQPAVGATSDRGSVLQRLLFFGLLGGIAGGLLAATLRANQPRMRALKWSW
jgi:capsular polysaccharide biosynthesis protein